MAGGAGGHLAGGNLFFKVVARRSGGTRTHDPRFWRPMLYQLSYTPKSAREAGSQRRACAQDSVDQG